MNDDWPDFENRLRRLRPAGTSATLRRQVEDHLRATRRSTLGAVACLVSLAALVLIGVFVGVSGQRSAPPQHPAAPSHSAASPDRTSFPPSLWAYQHAAAESLESLDALLDHHARTLPPIGERLDLPPWN